MRRNTLISTWQGAILLILFRVFHLLTLAPIAGNAQGGSDILLAMPLSYLLLAIVMLPAYFLLKRGGGSVISCATTLSAVAGKLTAMLFCAFSLLIATTTISSFTRLLTSEVFAGTSPLVFIISFAAVCAYAAFLGLEPITRMSSVIFIAFLAVGIFVSLAVLPRASLIYLKAPLQGGTWQFWQLVLSSCFANFDVVIWLLLAPNIKGGAVKSFAIWLVGALIALEYLVLLLTVGLGDYAGTQQFPFYSLAAFGEISVFQRLDSLHITLWTFIAFVKVSVYLYFATHCMGFFLPKPRKSIRAIIAGVVAVLAAWVISLGEGTLVAVQAAVQNGWLTAVLAVLLPVMLLLWQLVLGQKRGGKA